MQWFYLALECVLWQDPVNKFMNFWFLENAVLFLQCALKIKVAGSFKISVYIYQPARRHITKK